MEIRVGPRRGREEEKGKKERNEELRGVGFWLWWGTREKRVMTRPRRVKWVNKSLVERARTTRTETIPFKGYKINLNTLCVLTDVEDGPRNVHGRSIQPQVKVVIET